MAAGGELAHVDPGLGDGVLGGAAAPAGHGSGLLQLSSYGASSCSITSVSRAMSAVSRPMRSSMVSSRAACSAVKNSAPSRACSSSVILRRARARASWARTLGLRSPAIRWSMMSRPVTPCRSVTTAADTRPGSASEYELRAGEPERRDVPVPCRLRRQRPACYATAAQPISRSGRHAPAGAAAPRSAGQAVAAADPAKVRGAGT